VSSQRHPRAIFQRAIERGNLVVAEVTAREIGRISLVEALELTALVARRDPKRHRRFAARWLWRYLSESESVTIDDAAVAVGCLLALGGKRHDEALLALLGMAEQAIAERERG
jgi:polynucleotide 5'-kinase involved in rRNA processing